MIAKWCLLIDSILWCIAIVFFIYAAGAFVFSLIHSSFDGLVTLLIAAAALAVTTAIGIVCTIIIG